jgi:hypothetical protein
LEIGRIDADGRLWSRFGDFPYFSSVSAEEFIEKTHSIISIVLRDGRVLVRKQFRSNRDAYRRERHNSLLLQDRANVPRLHGSNDAELVLYKDLISGAAVNHMLVAEGAAVLQAQTRKDPAMAALDAKDRILAVLARGAAVARRCLGTELIREIGRQVRRIHACRVAKLSLTFGNVIVESRSGKPWLVDFEGAIAYGPVLHPMYLLHRVRDRRALGKLYGKSM